MLIGGNIGIIAHSGDLHNDYTLVDCSPRLLYFVLPGLGISAVSSNGKSWTAVTFEKNYDTQYSVKHGKYRIIHIKETVERFIECGDFSKGIARIKCTNMTCPQNWSKYYVWIRKVNLQKDAG